MQDLTDDFCEVCRQYLRNLFREMGLKPNPNGPASSDDPDPDCPPS